MQRPSSPLAERRLLHDEANLLQSLRHPCIVALEGVLETSKELCLILELCPAGDLRGLMLDTLAKQ